jgi:ribosomal protein L7Ae-like RNA K-turn-binding protein
MNNEKFLIAMTTSILSKIVMGLPLSDYDKNFMAGIKEGFESMEEKEQKSLVMFSDIHQAELEKKKGRVN